MSQRWPLTGRTEELRLMAGLGRQPDGPVGVVVAGAAGVGKTRLAREVFDAAAKRGTSTRWVAATNSARGLPLGAFAGLLGDVGQDPARVHRHAADALTAGAGPHGTLIAVDDAHLLDDVSAVLVHQLSLQRRANVLLTVRSGEPAPDAITSLWKDGYLHRLELEPLSEGDTRTLLTTVLGGPVETASARRLWHITQGNPLYLRQLVDGELSARKLSELAGVWIWSGQPELSPGLTELVRAQMGQMSWAVRDVVELLAFGEPLGVPVLTEMSKPEAVEEAEARGLIEVSSDGRRLEARLTHPLYGEAQRADCGRVRTRRIQGQLASALAGTGARRADDTIRRGVLSLDSDLRPNPELLTEAARRATQLNDLPLAARLARAAVEAGGGFEPALLLATVLVGGAAHEAEAELAALTTHARTDAERARAATMRVTCLAWISSRPGEAEEVLEKAKASIHDSVAKLELEALGMCLDATLGRPVQVAESVFGLLASPHLTDQAAAFASLGGVFALGVVGRIDEIDPLVVRGTVAVSRCPEVAWIAAPLLGRHALMLRLAGYLSEASAVAEGATERFTDLPGPLITNAVVRGAVELSAGRVRTSLRRLQEARADLASWEAAGGWTFECLLELTRALALSGDTAAARQALAALEAARHPAVVVLHPETTLARAWVMATEGAITEAIALAHEAATASASRGQRAHEVLALHTAVRFGDPTPARRLAELSTQVDGPRTPAAATHAAALDADDGHALEAASIQLEDVGDLLAAADAAAQAATVHISHDCLGSAQTAAARAHRLAQACEGATTPALVAAAAPLPLSEREREILTLAAAGCSNREIASRLFISVRTVEGHRYRASMKLGTSDLGQIAALLRGQ